MMTSSIENIFRVTCPFVRGIHLSSVNSPQKGQWCGALIFSLICALNKRLSKQSWCWSFETPSRIIMNIRGRGSDARAFRYKIKNDITMYSSTIDLNGLKYILLPFALSMIPTLSTYGHCNVICNVVILPKDKVSVYKAMLKLCFTYLRRTNENRYIWIFEICPKVRHR